MCQGLVVFGTGIDEREIGVLVFVTLRAVLARLW